MAMARLLRFGARVRRSPVIQHRAMASLPQDEDLTGLFEKAFKLFAENDLMNQPAQAKKKVVDFKHPHELQALLQPEVSREGCGEEELLRTLQTVIDYSVRTSHPHFYNQLYSRVDLYGVLGSCLTDLLNTNEHTYECAPVFILATKYVLARLSRLLGYTAGDGTFFPGGSMANFMAVHLARHRLLGGHKQRGLFGERRLVMYASQECHYSVQKAAMFMGFGLDSTVAVRTDAAGKMCPQDLEDKVKASLDQGDVPFFVLATSGTTVLGAYDPLEPIADVCDKYKLWMHVDGCWGGAVIFSENHRHLLKGVERSNSFNVSLHKLMAAPIQCVPFVVNDKTILSEANSIDVSYLFQPDKFYDTSFDMGTKTVQCGRRADAFKFWIMWKARGDQGLQEHVDTAFDNARYFLERIREREGFLLVTPDPEYVNVSFWYIPPRLRNKPKDAEWWEEVDKVAPAIKARMTLEGSMMIGYQPQRDKDRVNFFRIIINNPQLSRADLDECVDEIERLGQDL